MADAPSPQTFVLASASPRRKQLLGDVGLSFDVIAPDIDEAVRTGEAADAYVLRLAQEKAAQVAVRAAGRAVLAADTTVVLAGEILGKPADAAEAKAMLRRLSGRTHVVFTGVAVDGPVRSSTVVRTGVTFRTLSPEEISWYVGTGEPMDKAGGYAVQGKAANFVTALEGSPTNVIGLPMAEALSLLERAGVALPWSEA
jgi:septum formation protein